MATITNGMKTVLTTDKEVLGLGAGMFLHSLELLWEIAQHFEPGVLRVEPVAITQAILKYKDTPESTTPIAMDLSDWKMELYRLEERDVPYEFRIVQVELFVDERKLIAAI